jgi:membrane protease subunit HflC
MNRMNLNAVGIGIIVVVAIVGLFASAYIVDERKQVIITQFGRPVGDAIMEPGIYFKIPIVQKANYFEKRVLEWDGDPNEVPTKDKRFVWVDTYARWRIDNPLLYFQRVRDEIGAQSRLDDILDGGTRSAIANHNLDEVIRSTSRDLQASGNAPPSDVPVAAEQDALFGRDKVTRSIIEIASKQTRELGIELLDVRFKRINYVEEVQQKIYERMITERIRIADKFRSEGEGEAARIRGDKERELRIIESEAYRDAQRIMGAADAKATKIYADAYNPSEESREFYDFVQTLETYKEVLTRDDWLILSTSSDFFKYLNSPTGQ